ncbi:zinc ABC transporter substrate-binding protein [Thioclava sp. SK-1]|uniref:zinc ABC transporter substrate-binding protein n=1 Tax=Thioclava sp. SK-1 TaxID=1889770 RepID=UPI0008267C62|nr:zinc ABC transporter substrate-binding protein [Thioclava sp. SK-1]OCX61071.1 zinc ABC transporter substrate-binding protein [Thioclava sp. SK-1]
MRLFPICLSALIAASPTLAQVPQVMTDIPVVYSLTAKVMGDLATPDVLLDRGSDAHSYQLRPSQARKLQNADLVIWVGPELTPWLDRALDGLSGQTPQLSLLHTPGTELRNFADAPEAAHDHDHDHDHDGSHDHTDEHNHANKDHTEGHGDHDDHDHSGTDPHAWLDPHNAEHWLTAIADQLSTLDPQNAQTYRGNAAQAAKQLARLDSDLQAQLAPIGHKPFVTFHAAYGYFTDHYGLDTVGSLSMGDAAAPGAAHLSQLRDTLTQKNVLCAFPEPQQDPKPLQQVIEGTQTRLGAPLDPTGSTLPLTPALYETLLRSFGTALSECLTQTP